MGRPFGSGGRQVDRDDPNAQRIDPTGEVEDIVTQTDITGRPEHARVVGVAELDNQVGVYGASRGSMGVWGQSETGIGVYGRGGSFAGSFDGSVQVRDSVDIGRNVTVGGNARVGGDIEVKGDIRLINADCAEEFDILDITTADPGTVMVLGEEGVLRPSGKAYDRRVAGVICGAGGYRPGIILDSQTDGNRAPVALLGKVYCKVDAGFGPVEVGDLLTTSPTPGYAMRAADPVRAFGACLGKALRPLPAGQGLIPILVTLQ